MTRIADWSPPSGSKYRVGMDVRLGVLSLNSISPNKRLRDPGITLRMGANCSYHNMVHFPIISTTSSSHQYQLTKTMAKLSSGLYLMGLHVITLHFGLLTMIKDLFDCYSGSIYALMQVGQLSPCTKVERSMRVSYLPVTHTLLGQ